MVVAIGDDDPLSLLVHCDVHRPAQLALGIAGLPGSELSDEAQDLVEFEYTVVATVGDEEVIPAVKGDALYRLEHQLFCVGTEERKDHEQADHLIS